ncbi:MAG: hypothetical protein SPK48_03410, partial [Bullifex sp.]|nr:hypothetical protein [Spirochaetales bacterium]MDY5776878.1 hypothetical protein [Bullifex sp.]
LMECITQRCFKGKAEGLPLRYKRIYVIRLEALPSREDIIRVYEGSSLRSEFIEMHICQKNEFLRIFRWVKVFTTQ